MSEEFVCEKCGKVFDSGSKLRGHNMTCKGPTTADDVPRETLETIAKPAARRERVPLGVPRRKLSWGHKDPNFVYRVIHNRPGKPNRVNEALAAGYEFVEDNRHMGDTDVSNEMGGSTDSKVTHIVGDDDRGNPMTGYLMRIRKEFYEEDQKKKMEIVDERERQMIRGVDTQGQPGRDGRYIPTDPSGQPITRIERR